MQSKMFVAAALTASSTAFKLETPKTVLAQSDDHHHHHKSHGEHG